MVRYIRATEFSAESYIQSLVPVLYKSESKFDFWGNMTDGQRNDFTDCGMSFDELYNAVKDIAGDFELSEWKPASSGSYEDFYCPYDYSKLSIEFQNASPRADGWQADATFNGKVRVRNDGISNWESVIAHEAGHQLSNYNSKLQEVIIRNPDDILGRYNKKKMYFDGIYGEYNPDEAWATLVSNYVRHPSLVKSKYPKAYRAVEEFFRSSPSAYDYVLDAIELYKTQFIENFEGY